MFRRSCRPLLFPFRLSVIVVLIAWAAAAHAQLPPELRERLRAGTGEILFESSRAQTALRGKPEMPMVEVAINGQRFEFLVDAGGNVVSIKESAATRAGARVLHQVDRRAIVELETLSLAGVRLRNLVAVSHPDLDVDGVLGFNIFRQGLLTFDYLGRKLVWEKDGSLSGEANPACVTYELRNRMPFVPVRAGDVVFYFVLDTGATGEFIVPKSLEASLPWAGPAEPGGRVWNEQTGASSTEMRRLAVDLEVGGVSVPRPLLMLNPALEEGDLLLGSGFLRRFRLRFDLTERQVCFEESVQTNP